MEEQKFALQPRRSSNHLYPVSQRENRTRYSCT